MIASARPVATDDRIAPVVQRRCAAVAGAAALLVAGWVIVTTAATAQVSQPHLAWTLTWIDQFNGPPATGVSPADWLYATGTGYPGGAPHWGTGEVETMTDSIANVAHDGSGHLAITPRRDDAGRWTSGRIETRRTDFAAPVGGALRVEVTVQQPDVTGAAAAGYWPSVWMMGEDARPVGATNWPQIGEIDIAEGVNGRGSHFVTLHCGTFPDGPCNEPIGISSGERPCPGCQTEFHTYAVEYDRSVSPEQVRWYLDGANVFTIDATRVDSTTWHDALHHGFFLIIDVAMGGDLPAAFGGGPTPATQPDVPMLIDYVAVYTRAPASPSPTAAPTDGGRDAYSTIQAEVFDAQYGTQNEPCVDTGSGLDVTSVATGDWLRFDNIDFGTTAATQLIARVASGATGAVSGLVEVRLDDLSSLPVGDFAIANTGGWQSWRTIPANVSAVTGVHTVYLTFSSGQPADFVNVNWFTFGH